MWTPMLEFFAAQLKSADKKPFGALSDKDIVIPKVEVPTKGKRTKWVKVIVLLYLIIGLIVAIFRKQKRALLLWWLPKAIKN
jgi:hypothetical protein